MSSAARRDEAAPNSMPADQAHDLFSRGHRCDRNLWEEVARDLAWSHSPMFKSQHSREQRVTPASSGSTWNKPSLQNMCEGRFRDFPSRHTTTLVLHFLDRLCRSRHTSTRLSLRKGALRAWGVRAFGVVSECSSSDADREPDQSGLRPV